MMAEKRGRSWYRNFGWFESRRALMRVRSSLMSGLARFSWPAMTSTLFTALMPKS